MTKARLAYLAAALAAGITVAVVGLTSDEVAAQSRVDVFTPTDIETTLAEFRPLPDGGVSVTGYVILHSADGGSTLSMNGTLDATTPAQRTRALQCLDYGEKVGLKTARVGPGTLP